MMKGVNERKYNEKVRERENVFLVILIKMCVYVTDNISYNVCVYVVKVVYYIIIVM